MNSDNSPITTKLYTSILQNKAKSAVAAIVLMVGSLGLIATNDSVRNILGLPVLPSYSI
jgi:hypothetical protein